MTKLIADMSMSLDGRVASPDDDISRLVRWFFDGDTEVAPGAPFKTSENSARLLRDALGSIGAIIGGRRYFDLADGWGGRHPMGVPVYILTHEPPPTGRPTARSTSSPTGWRARSPRRALRPAARTSASRPRASCVSAWTPACSTSSRST